MLTMIAVMALSVGAVQEQKSDVPAADRRICKKTADTGSLVRRVKECRTRAEWDRIAEGARAGGQDIVDRGAGGIISN